MRTQKGVTLVSLTIYVIVMTIVVAIVATISTYFYTNMNSNYDTINPLAEYTKFNSFFSEQVNHENIKILECEESYIVFDNEVQYLYIPENKGIYRNQVKICNDVENCKFEYKIKNGKNIVVVTIKIGSQEEKNVEYTLKN